METYRGNSTGNSPDMSPCRGSAVVAPMARRLPSLNWHVVRRRRRWPCSEPAARLTRPSCGLSSRTHAVSVAAEPAELQMYRLGNVLVAACTFDAAARLGIPAGASVVSRIRAWSRWPSLGPNVVRTQIS